VRETLHPDPDFSSKSSVQNLPPARFGSNKEDEEQKSPKKRVFKEGNVEIPNHQKLGKLKTTTEQLDFCLGLKKYTEDYSTTAFTAGSKTFVVRKLKPILKCFRDCCKGETSSFLKHYPRKLKLGVFGSGRCGHK
jgi:hypothetical protein